MENEIDYLDILLILLSAFTLLYLLPLYFYTKVNERDKKYE